MNICSICFDEINNTVTDCNHSFCKGCIDTWKELTGNYWMIRAHELSESIPWVYTHLIGSTLLK